MPRSMVGVLQVIVSSHRQSPMRRAGLSQRRAAVPAQQQASVSLVLQRLSGSESRAARGDHLVTQQVRSSQQSQLMMQAMAMAESICGAGAHCTKVL